MKKFKKQYHIHLICFVVIIIYTGISIGVDICHNHEDASSFHDDCAACRWLDQSQDTDSSTTVVHVFMFSPDTKAPNFIIFDESSLPTQFYWFNFLTRSPPSSISWYLSNNLPTSCIITNFAWTKCYFQSTDVSFLYRRRIGLL